MLPSKPCLIIAQSGRALAASAVRANIKTHVIDRFADTDTRCIALSTRVITGNIMGLCAWEILDGLNDYTDIPLTGVVIGSGLESSPELLNVINARVPLLGNLTDCVNNCKDPARFFVLLDSLGIPHPDTRLSFSGYKRDWLVKRIGATGGQHINCSVKKISQLSDHYFQKFIQGRSISAVFIANGEQAQIIGLNETWTRARDIYDFCYAGAVTLPSIDKKVLTTLCEIARILVKQLGLVGLCGIDVIIDKDGECQVLEINPRPPATFELHERGFSLFHAHIMACNGKLATLPPGETKSCGHEILFTPVNFHVPELVWPDWVVDRPAHGFRIASGEPICTILAAANTSDEVRTKLLQRKASMFELLGLQRIAA